MIMEDGINDSVFGNDVGILKNRLISQIPLNAAQQINWIHFIKCDENKQKIVTELINIYHDMRKVVESKALVKYKINLKKFFVELLNSVFIIIQCCNQFYIDNPEEDEQIDETNNILWHYMSKAINALSTAMKEVKTESKLFLGLFVIDEDSVLSHEKTQKGLIRHYNRFYELLKPLSFSNVPKRFNNTTMMDFIFDNYDNINNTIMNKKVNFKDVLVKMGEKNSEYDDGLIDAVTELINEFISLQTIFKKDLDSNMQDKKRISRLINDFKRNITRVKEMSQVIYDELPEDVIVFHKLITEDKNKMNSSTEPSSSSSSASNSVSKTDPWEGKKTRKRSASQKMLSNKASSSNTDNNEPQKKRQFKRPPNPAGSESKAEYREKHHELFNNGQKLLSEIDITDYTDKANEVVEHMKEKIFNSHDIDEETQNLIIEKVNLKNMIRQSEQKKDDNKLEAFRKCDEIVANYFNNNKGDIIIPSDYCFRYSDGVYGKNAPYLIIYVFFNFSDVENPVALKLIPIYTLNKIISFKTLTVFVLAVKKTMDKNNELKTVKAEKKTDDKEKNNLKNKRQKNDVIINEYEQKLKPLNLKMQKITTRFNPARFNLRIKSIIKDFADKNNISVEKSNLDKLFPKLLHKREFVPQNIDNFELQGCLPQTGELVMFNNDVEGDKRLFLYQSCMSILRRFKEKRNGKMVVCTKQYQLYLVLDSKKDAILSGNVKSKYGFFGFIEKENVFRFIHDIKDIDPITRSMIDYKDGRKYEEDEEIDYDAYTDHSIEYNKSHKEWVYVAAGKTVNGNSDGDSPKSQKKIAPSMPSCSSSTAPSDKTQKSKQTVNTVVKKSNLVPIKKVTPVKGNQKKDDFFLNN